MDGRLNSLSPPPYQEAGADQDHRSGGQRGPTAVSDRTRTGSGTGKPVTALVLQGGGAMGAYHLGCYQAMEEAGYRPDWVSGISIGAFNSAIIAGNPPERVMERLEELWRTITRPDVFDLGTQLSGELLRLYRYASAFQAMVFGQPHFFGMRLPFPQFGIPGTDGALSYGDNTPMRDTLLRLADFDQINSGPVRLSLGATRVTTGELVFFDSRKERIGPEHVMASGALPPGFPPTRIEGELYWDGGCVSNTPLDAITDDLPPGRVLVFMIDLWGARGPEPRTIDDVSWRQLQIQYASRTSHHIDAIAKRQNARRALERVTRTLSPEQMTDPGVRDACALACPCKMDIVQVIYQPDKDQIWMSDREFSRSSVAERRAAGYADMTAALAAAPWENDQLSPPEAGAVIHRCRGGDVRSRTPLALEQGPSLPMASLAEPVPA